MCGGNPCSEGLSFSFSSPHQRCFRLLIHNRAVSHPIFQVGNPVFFRHRAFVCGGNPCSEGFSFHFMFTLDFNSHFQAGAHGILDPPCATKLRSWMGYQGWSPWRTCSLSPWIIREIPIRYVFSVFTHFCDFCPITDKDRLPEQVMELAKQSSGPFREYERFIDEIPSFKCVFGRESVMVLSWSGNCRRVHCIPLIWLRPSIFHHQKIGGMSGPCPEKNTRQYTWVVLTMNRSHQYFFESYPIWFGTNFPFCPLEMSNSSYGFSVHVFSGVE